MKYVSPGVYVREIDLSLYIPALSSTIAAMVGTAVKGPVNTRTFVASVNQFLDLFGNPAEDYFMPYAALQYLRRGKQLWVVRVAGASAAEASVTLDVMKPATLVGSTASVTVGSSDGALKVTVTDGRNNVPDVYTATIVVPAATYLVSDLADTINNLLNTNAVLSNWVGASSLPDTGSTAVLRLIAHVADPLVKIKLDPTVTNNGSVLMGFAATSTPTAPSGTPATTGGTLAAGTYNYKISAIGPNGESIASAASADQVVASGTTGSVALTWTAVTGATSYKVWGRDLGAGVGSTFNFIATTSAALYTDTGIATDTSLSAPATALIETAGVDTGKDIKIKADSVGSWGNNLSVVITQKKGWKNDISIWEKTPTNTTGFRTELLPSTDLYNASGNNNFLGIVAGTAEDSDGRRSTEVLYENTTSGTALPAATRFLVLKTGSFALTSGDDDNAGVTDGSYVGINEPAPTGLQLFRNSDEVDVNILMVPGITTAPVLNELLSICEERQDVMCILDTPLGYSPQQVVDWHNGQGAFTGDHQAFNSSYGAMYWPWLEIYDPYNNKRLWTPPCGQVSAVYAWTDFIAETWSAPAGHNRAHLTSALRVQYNASLGEREHLYGNQNSINPIVNFPKDGITIWGQKTLQRAPTALDRVNVRRLLLYMKKVIATASRYLVFEPNDAVTWRQFVRLVTPFCESVKSRRGLYDFAVICDETTNTPYFIDQNTMVGKIFLQPVKTAERINIDFVITPTGAKFDEILY